MYSGWCIYNFDLIFWMMGGRFKFNFNVPKLKSVCMVAKIIYYNVKAETEKH